jgi:hypothetical protein
VCRKLLQWIFYKIIWGAIAKQEYLRAVAHPSLPVASPSQNVNTESLLFEECHGEQFKNNRASTGTLNASLICGDVSFNKY